MASKRRAWRNAAPSPPRRRRCLKGAIVVWTNRKQTCGTSTTSAMTAQKADRMNRAHASMIAGKLASVYAIDCLKTQRSPACVAEQRRMTQEPRQSQYGQARLFELTVFAASAIEPDISRAAITSRLTRNAGPHPGKRMPSRLRDFLAACLAVWLAVTRRHARPCSHYLVRHGIVDLILHGSIRSPSACHCRCPVPVVGTTPDGDSNLRFQSCSPGARQTGERRSP